LASVVVCNGGSATSYQALSQGKPVVCLWGNIDQYLTSQVIAGSGAGLACRADGHETGEFKDLVAKVLMDKGFTESANKVSELFRTHDVCKRFADFLGSIPELM